MPEINDTGQEKGFSEYMPPMSEAEITAELKAKGATQEQLDLDISHLNRNELVDPQYLPALAAQMMREGRMPNFRNPRVRGEFGRMVEEATREVQVEDEQKRNK